MKDGKYDLIMIFKIFNIYFFILMWDYIEMI